MRRLWMATLILASTALLAACGADESDGTATGTGEPTLQTADSDLGTILVDGEGRTVYMFTRDSPGTSVCEGECLEFWPPVQGDVVAGDGVDADLLGTTEATDGTVMATYGGWPLYYYAQDGEGDTSGQGVDKEWYVLNPAGEPVKKAPQPDPPAGGGYAAY